MFMNMSTLIDCVYIICISIYIKRIILYIYDIIIASHEVHV